MKSLKLLSVLFLMLLCGVAQAQRSFDLGKIFDVGKSAAGALKDVSEPEEIDIGRDLAGRLLGQIQLVDDANVQAYVNRVGRWVASQSERPDLPWKFGVANAGNVNAMAMPGGTILITRGLYDLLDNEAQLAGVLGHEIAHVVKRHHITVMRQQSGVSALASAGGMFLDSRGGGGAAGKMLSNAALNVFKEMFIKGLDKNAEFEADAMGVILAARAGYNSFGLAEVLHKLNARTKSDPSVAFLFETHPAPSDRLTKLGDLLTPRLATLPEGLEPQITPVSATAAAPSSGPAPATPGVRALTNEPARNTGSAVQPTQPSVPGSNPLDALKGGFKGLFGR